MQNVEQISKELIYYANVSRYPITNLSLQKLLYFLQKEYFIKYGKLLFTEEFYAFKYGPVQPKIWKKYSSSGKSVLISSEIVEVKEYMKLVDKYFYYDVWDLVELSHNEECWKKHVGGFYNEIKNKELKEYWNVC